MIVLDTNVLSESFRVDAADEVVEFVTQTPGLAITSISVFELLNGARRLPHGRRQRGIVATIESVVGELSDRVLPYDASAARMHAELAERTRAEGRALSTEDGMIAGICRERGAALATRNTRDFRALGIELINPWAVDRLE